MATSRSTTPAVGLPDGAGVAGAGVPGAVGLGLAVGFGLGEAGAPPLQGAATAAGGRGAGRLLR